jgi:mannose-6-phosphate isomerase-like protein (cupin superfamily)
MAESWYAARVSIQLGGRVLTRHQLSELAMKTPGVPRRFELADLTEIPPVDCPCGSARRAFADLADYPATIHRTEISADARVHYHKRLTETYYFLDCAPDAQMQLDDECLAVRPGMCVVIRPGCRHRAIGKMTVLIVSMPKFDPADEWFD